MSATPQNGVRSFEPSSRNIVTAANGARVHVLHAEHLQHLQRRLFAPTPGVWCLVGNGLSNQTFVEGPEGIIAIDTGECVEEMRAALKELRSLTSKPIVAVMYTHFHYVGGTSAIFQEAGHPLPVYAHEGIIANRARVADEIGPAYTRGLVEQFALNLPTEGPDAMAHVGLGLTFRFPQYAPFTPGFEPPTITTAAKVRWKIAGLEVEVTPAPSDATDSVTIWIPEFKVAVQNLVWPTLFNIFAIRGEEYRDPRILLNGIDHLRELGAEYLLGAHGPPLIGKDEIAARVEKYRDAIQFLWDQTVRGINKGWTVDEIAERVRLPTLYDNDFITSERYGVVEHHARQIHNGLRGWFDGDPANLFPLPQAERARRLVEGFGGPDKVRRQADAAIASDDLRWATELSSWLVKAPSMDEQEQTNDRNRLAACLRRIGQGTPAANIRSWALTKARDLEGVAPMDRYRVHRFRKAAVLADPCAAAQTLRVLLHPERALGQNLHLRFDFAGGATCGIHVRNAIACPTDGSNAQSVVSVSPSIWADILTGKLSLKDAARQGAVKIQGDPGAVLALWDCFEISASR